MLMQVNHEKIKNDQIIKGPFRNPNYTDVSCKNQPIDIQNYLTRVNGVLTYRSI